MTVRAVRRTGLAGTLVTKPCRGFLLASSSVDFDRIVEGAEQEGYREALGHSSITVIIGSRHSQLDQPLPLSRNTSLEIC